MNLARIALALFLSVLLSPALFAQNSVKKMGCKDRPLNALAFGDHLWGTTPERLEQAFKANCLQWHSADRSQGRFFGGGLYLWNHEVPVHKSTSRFPNTKLGKVNLSIFNPGDSAN